ncbi:VCBS domain-containing protein, partial [Novosphingobium sp.]|uniref:VCBS domain-containing protein n=1 Tax=Novosphingobium sp. TaxID=1874826 RepID=UPI00286A2F8D
MGDIVNAGGTTTSFSNTPQAKDDSYVYTEDQLIANGLLYNQLRNVLTLDVMANDLGGNAKSLFSIDDGYGNQVVDLSKTDLLGNTAYSDWQTTANGNQIRIYNGKIEYRLSDGHGGIRDVNSLNAGEVIADSFTYAIKLGNGTLSWARVSINLTGNNDVATITGNTAGSVTEAGVPGPGIPDASGVLTVHDVDAGQSAFAAPATTSLNGTYGVFTFNAATGQWTYHLDNSRAATQALAQGEQVAETLKVNSLDGTATQNVVIHIAGTNDAPVITSAAQSGSVKEDTTLTATGTVSASDV